MTLGKRLVICTVLAALIGTGHADDFLAPRVTTPATSVDQESNAVVDATSGIGNDTSDELDYSESEYEMVDDDDIDDEADEESDNVRDLNVGAMEDHYPCRRRYRTLEIHHDKYYQVIIRLKKFIHKKYCIVVDNHDHDMAAKVKRCRPHDDDQRFYVRNDGYGQIRLAKDPRMCLDYELDHHEHDTLDFGYVKVHRCDDHDDDQLFTSPEVGRSGNIKARSFSKCFTGKDSHGHGDFLDLQKCNDDWYKSQMWKFSPVYYREFSCNFESVESLKEDASDDERDDSLEEDASDNESDSDESEDVSELSETNYSDVDINDLNIVASGNYHHERRYRTRNIHGDKYYEVNIRLKKKSHHKKLCITIHHHGYENDYVNVERCREHTHEQRFYVRKHGHGQIRWVKHPHLCLDVEHLEYYGHSDHDFSGVRLRHCEDDAGQFFRTPRVGHDGKIKTHPYRRCFTARHPNKHGADLSVESCHDDWHNGQIWKFSPRYKYYHH